MCRYVQKLGLNRKKKHGTVAKREQKEYKNSELSIGKKSEISRPRTSVFLDETGMMLGLARSHARSPLGTRVGGIKPFYRGAFVTAIGAISVKKVLAVITLNDSMHGVAFSVFIEKFLCPQLWPGAVVVIPIS